MAQVTVQKKEVPVVQTIKSVIIELTPDEASQLFAIVGAGAGLVDALYSKLSAQGVTAGRYVTDLSGSNIKVKHNPFTR